MRFSFLAGLLLTALLFLSKPAFAQSDSSAVNTKLASTQKAKVNARPATNLLWTVKFSPQHLFINGYNLEIERRVSPESNHSFTFSPRFYSGGTKMVDKLSGRESDYEGSRVKGFGAEFTHRIYKPSLTNPAKQQYFAFGFNYHKFTLDYGVLAWGKVIDRDGIEKYKYDYQPRQDQISRVGGLILFGAQNPFFKNRFISDFYGGLGFRTGQNNNTESETFRTNILDYGSSGLYLTVGFKVGYAF